MAHDVIPVEDDLVFDIRTMPESRLEEGVPYSMEAAWIPSFCSGVSVW